MLENVFFIAMRRMRAPLISLIVTLSISVLGLVLIPGRNPDGGTDPMSVFHALYFVSYMATTIGFGEIPHELSDAQRLWVLFCIYATVVVWLYSIGSLLALIQDKAFQQAWVERRFAHQVQRMKQPFFLICGFGETAEVLVDDLVNRGQHAVVIEPSEERINVLRLNSLPDFVPALCGDSSRPSNLLKAGLKHPLCAGVAALTNNSGINLKVAISSKLLHPEVKVLCRVDSHEIAANMASFGTDFIIDPFDTFAYYLSLCMRSPCLSLLHDWLTGVVYSPLSDPVYPPRRGLWVVCGYGRFGKAVCRTLEAEDIEVVVIEATPEKTGAPDGRLVVGRGTEAGTLRQADVERAVGLVAGTDDDVNNLSIVMTARELNPGLFVIARQNRQENHELFDAVKANVLMHPSQIIANRIRALLATPLLYDFEGRAFAESDAWACELISRVSALVQLQVPHVWELRIAEEDAYAVHHHLGADGAISLEALLRDPRDREKRLDCIPLLIRRDDACILLPKDDEAIHLGDRMLLCAAEGVKDRMGWSLQNQHALRYVLEGDGPPHRDLLGSLMRRWRRWRGGEVVDSPRGAGASARPRDL